MGFFFFKHQLIYVLQKPITGAFTKVKSSKGKLVFSFSSLFSAIWIKKKPKSKCTYRYSSSRDKRMGYKFIYTFIQFNYPSLTKL